MTRDIDKKLKEALGRSAEEVAKEWYPVEPISVQCFGSNLEDDLANNPKIRERIKEESFAEDLWSALTNMHWTHSLGNEEGFSFRYAGGVIADLRNEILGTNECYMSWYCCKQAGIVSEEIKELMFEMGWVPKEYEKL